jgi:hypothetical protein
MKQFRRPPEKSSSSLTIMYAYIDIKGVAVDRHELTDSELQEIGEFTRENVSRWLKAWLKRDCNRVFWGALNYFDDDDFHAVCGDIDIPWADEDTKRKWDERFPNY